MTDKKINDDSIRGHRLSLPIFEDALLDKKLIDEVIKPFMKKGDK